MTRWSRALVVVVGVAACATQPDASGDSTTVSSGPDSQSSEVSTDGTTSTGGEREPNTSIDAVDVAGDHGECDIWAQDCPDGEKCMPWASDDIGFDATRCTPVHPNPGQAGDPCSWQGGGKGTAVDDCDIASMCWNGACAPFCQGTAEMPMCADPEQSCAIANEGVVIVCLPSCDPILQDCLADHACYPVDDVFVCVPDLSGLGGAYGDACEYINVCDPGLFCAPAEAVASCEHVSGCCATYCDLDDAESMCPGAAGGEQCVPWYGEGEAPPGLATLGACVIGG